MIKVLPSGKSDSAPRGARAYPWISIALATVLLCIVTANANTFGVFFKPIAEGFGWSRGAVSIAIAVRWLLAAVLIMPIGHLSDRYGPRRVLLPCFLLLTISFLLTPKITAVWHLYLLQGLVGPATTGPFVCLISTVAKWRDKKRGLALGIASAGAAMGAVVFPPLAASLITARGWEQASIALGLLTLVIAIPASMLMKNLPLTTSPRGETANGDIENNRVGRNKGPFDVMRSLPRLLRDRQFASWFMIFLLFFIGVHLVMNHLVNYVTDTGIGTSVAATMMSAIGIAGVAGRLVMGPISDRIDTRVDAAVCCAFVAVALVLLTLKLEPLMWVAVVLFGVGFGGAGPLTPVIAADYFGTEKLATMTGAILISGNLGAAIGPWMGGVVFDLTDSYIWALFLSAVLAAIGVVIALRLGSPNLRDRSACPGRCFANI